MQAARSLKARLVHPLIFLAMATAIGAAAANCSATNGDTNGFTNDTGTTTGTGQGGGSSSTSSGGQGGEIIIPDGGPDAPPDVYINPCGTACGPTELCDDAHLGLDDDCDGQVDEICDCAAGTAHSCFKGDPSYHNTTGCYDGTEKCSENGKWGACLGGVHATDNCFSADLTNCHPISAVPFETVDLKNGTGNFSANAVAGSETWSVACPAGVNPCPAVAGASPPDDFQPLQSGEYTVTYTKGVSGGGTESCTYPLFVGAPGLRVELEWEHDVEPCAGFSCGVDVDLHLHQPNNTLPWAISGEPQDCGYGNCKIETIQLGFNQTPTWFPMGNVPPDPVNWYKDPVFEKNLCYFAPRGAGQQWQSYGQGCHNPRLDIDNIYCDPTISDPEDPDFCAPENINVDFPPQGEWFRIGVHYYSSHGVTYAVHPKVKIYCNGSLAADLGAIGYYSPETPVTFEPADGSGFNGNRFWMVADVAFSDDACDTSACTVKPLYADQNAKTPLFVLDTVAETNFGPGYPPPP